MEKILKPLSVILLLGLFSSCTPEEAGWLAMAGAVAIGLSTQNDTHSSSPTQIYYYNGITYCGYDANCECIKTADCTCGNLPYYCLSNAGSVNNNSKQTQEESLSKNENSNSGIIGVNYPLYFKAKYFEIINNTEDITERNLSFELQGLFVKKNNFSGTEEYITDECFTVYGFQIEYAPIKHIIQKRSFSSYSIIENNYIGANLLLRMSYTFQNQESRRLVTGDEYKILGLYLYGKYCDQEKDTASNSKEETLVVFWDCENCDRFTVL